MGRWIKWTAHSFCEILKQEKFSSEIFFPDNFVQHVLFKSLKIYNISINFIVFVVILKSVSHIYVKWYWLKNHWKKTLKSWWRKKLLNGKTCYEGDLTILISIRLVFNLSISPIWGKKSFNFWDTRMMIWSIITIHPNPFLSTHLDM